VIGARREHEVIDGELAAAPEQIRERALALWPLEYIGLFDLDPGQLTACGAESIQLMGDGFLLGEQRLAGGKPFLAGGDFRQGLSGGWHDHFSFDCGTELVVWACGFGRRLPNTSALKLAATGWWS
jgi:hypothetical protein